jgi:UDP-glucose 4-epimerase
MAVCGASTLVAGGAGFVGSHVVLALLDAGHRVVVIDNLSGGFRWTVDRRAVFFEGDIQNASLVRAIMEMHRVSSIVQCAGTNPVAGTNGDPLEYYRNNTSATRSLIESGIACGVGTFLYSSTAETYALPCVAPIPETARQQPAHPFAMSKLVVERILADTSAVHRLNHGVLRYFNAVGADPLGRSGQVQAGATHTLKHAVETLLGMQDHVAVPDTGDLTPDGSPIRDYVHVSDLAQAHAAMLDALLADPDRNLTLNCGYGRGISDFEVLEAAERVTNVRIARRRTALQPGVPPMLVADSRAIRETLGWMPRHDDLEQIIRHSYDWQMRLPRLLMRQAEGAMTAVIDPGQKSHKAVR